VPFSIASNITFDKLHTVVAEKLRRFPGLIQLRYRLDSDKQNAGATSIQSVEELNFFKEHMRVLLVPQRLASGKISVRALKPVRVYFEDAADENSYGAKDSTTGKAGSKKVSSYISRYCPSC
jgi:hypothetical protein